MTKKEMERQVFFYRKNCTILETEEGNVYALLFKKGMTKSQVKKEFGKMCSYHSINPRDLGKISKGSIYSSNGIVLRTEEHKIEFDESIKCWIVKPLHSDVVSNWKSYSTK